jgi:hypothetical protein
VRKSWRNVSRASLKITWVMETNMMAGGETQSIGRGDLRSNGLECAYFPQLRLGQTVFIRNLRDFADDPEDFGSCVDLGERVSH